MRDFIEKSCSKYIVTASIIIFSFHYIFIITIVVVVAVDSSKLLNMRTHVSSERN